MIEILEALSLTPPDEQLTNYLGRGDGAYQIKYEQLCPVKYNSGNGSFGGYWVTFQAEYIFPTQAALRWTLYACETGHPIGKRTFRN